MALDSDGGAASLRNRMRIMVPCQYLGGGSFGNVFRMSAVPWSAVGDVKPEAVAVKVMSKMTMGAKEGNEDQGRMDKHMRRELEILTMLTGTTGVVQLKSWTEGLFDVHLVFPLYPEDLKTYIRRGALKIVQPGDSDKLPNMCKQLLPGLGHLQSLQILHRDIKPANILVDASAVGDAAPAVGGAEKPTVVIADFGGAVHVNVGRVMPVKQAGSDPQTYQYRAPELFVRKHCRCYSFPCDVWAMQAMMRSQMDEIFQD